MKMYEFFERISHEEAYTTATYQYITLVGKQKVRVYRISRYALSRNTDLFNWFKYSQFWDLCYERFLTREDNDLPQLTINIKNTLDF